MRNFIISMMLITMLSVSSVLAQKTSKNSSRAMVSLALNQPSASGIDFRGNPGLRVSFGKEHFVNPDAVLDLYTVSTLGYNYESFEAKSGYNTTTTRHKLMLPLGLGLRFNMTNRLGIFLEAGPYASFAVSSKSNFDINRWSWGGHSNLGLNIGPFTAMLGLEISGNKGTIKISDNHFATDRTAYLSIGMRF